MPGQPGYFVSLVLAQVVKTLLGQAGLVPLRAWQPNIVSGA